MHCNVCLCKSKSGVSASGELVAPAGGVYSSILAEWSNWGEFLWNG